jgi:hypothetical protein
MGEMYKPIDFREALSCIPNFENPAGRRLYEI